MASRHTELRPQDIGFIEAQPLYFVATAMSKGTINLSPKGLDSLRVAGPTRVIWLNLTGSGNETALHLDRDGRITLMFCSFADQPTILRLYGHARAVHPDDSDWASLYARFKPNVGARQIIDCSIDLVQRSCGFGVPLMDIRGQRGKLDEWSKDMGEQGIKDYWRKRNHSSLDGLPVRLPEAD